MASMVSNSVPFHVQLHPIYKTWSHRRLLPRIAAAGLRKAKNRSIVGANGSSSEFDKTRIIEKVPEKLEALWDDGFGKASAKDYIDAAKEIISQDGGPPRWFCPVECGRPIKDSPVLLFLPGIDGTGMGLILHHKPLGRVFELRCLHIPLYDRTPFQGLVKIVEETVRFEHALSPRKPIYLVGDSFGGCLALAVAARNPTIDLVLILSNPATSFGRSQLQPLLATLEAFPDKLYNFTIEHVLRFTIGDTMKLTMANIDKGVPLRVQLQQQYHNFTSLLERLPDLVNLMPQETLIWKLKLLKSAASYANSRLHAIEAEVLILASAKDNVLPSTDEARRLMNSIKKCRVRVFSNNGHTLLMEDGISLMRVIKGTNIYRHSRKHDFVLDFLPPSRYEHKTVSEKLWFLHHLVHPVVHSTLEDGKIVRGLDGVPTEGPVLFVGNHMLWGLELCPLINEFLCEKDVMLRGLAHPFVFNKEQEESPCNLYAKDWCRIFGATPVTASNFFKLMSEKSHVLLYPGGEQEALHIKENEYKIYWPDEPEFVRIAAKFGATIVPFGVVGEDDLATSMLSYDDIMKIPVINGYLSNWISDIKNKSLRESFDERLLSFLLMPKINPGRIYFRFGRPIKTRGREEMVKDRESANKVYLQIKKEVEHNISYLLRKREEDPYRNSIERLLYRVSSSPARKVPTFEH